MRCFKQLGARVALVSTVVLSLALAGPVRAADEPYPGSKACMSDEQLKRYLTYLILSYFPRYMDACREIDHRLKEELGKAFIAYETSSYWLVEKLAAEVTEILRPAYRDEAGSVRVAMRKLAADREFDRALDEFDSDDCKVLIHNMNVLSGEITPVAPGARIEQLIERSLDAERRFVPRCPS